MKNADYRQFNDRTLNSSTYLKKDGTVTRAKLKQSLRRTVSTLVLANTAVRYSYAGGYNG